MTCPCLNGMVFQSEGEERGEFSSSIVSTVIWLNNHYRSQKMTQCRDIVRKMVNNC